MLEKRVSGNHFVFQNFLGEGPRLPARGLRAFGARGRQAPPVAAPRTSTQSCRESLPVHLQIDFTPYAYGSHANKYFRKIKINLRTKVEICISTYLNAAIVRSAPPGERSATNAIPFP